MSTLDDSGDADTPPTDTEHRTEARTDGGQHTGTDSVPWTHGFLAGVGAFAVGYLFTYVKESGEAAESFSSLSGMSSSPETWQGIGWLFMAMHNVTLEVTGSMGSQTMSQTFGSGSIEEQWMLLVPVVALLLAGYYVASKTDTGANVSGAKAGATVVAGYFVCVVAIAFLSEWTMTTTSFGQTLTVSAGPKLVESVAIAGIGYPVILGAIGGALGDA